MATCDKCHVETLKTIDMWVFMTVYYQDEESYTKTGEEFTDHDGTEYCDYRVVCYTCWLIHFRPKWLRLVQLTEETT